MRERDLVNELREQGWVTEAEAAAICGLKCGSNVRKVMEKHGITVKIIARMGLERGERRMYWRGDVGQLGMRLNPAPAPAQAPAASEAEAKPAAATAPVASAAPAIDPDVIKAEGVLFFVEKSIQALREVHEWLDHSMNDVAGTLKKFENERVSAKEELASAIAKRAAQVMP